MAGSDGAILLTTARWTSGSGGGGGGVVGGSGGNGVNGIGHDSDPLVQQQLYLHEVVKAGDLPQMVRIVKGSYLGLGAPSLPNPSLSSTALIASAGSSLRLAVQCLKFKDNHKTVNVGPKLAIPETFDGYFEILNEDGRAVRCIESVVELARKSPDSCLVRQNVKAYYVPSDSQSPQPSPMGPSSSSGSATTDAVFVGDRTRTLTSGELLVLVGPVSSGRYLRCLDSRGDHVYLPMELRAKFSAVAKEDAVGSISGVHRIRALLNKRLPLTVRMVSGSPPAGLKIGQQFCYEMRLLASFREEMVVALPLVGSNKDGSQSGVVIIPPTVSLKLQLPANRQSLKASKEFQRLTERCLHQYGLMSDRIQVYDAHFSKNLRFDGQHWKVPVPLLLAPLRRSTSDLIHSITGSSKHSNVNNNNKLTGSQSVEMLQQLPEEEELNSYGCPEKKKMVESDEILPEYDEIDQIYDYIRGFAPLPKNLKAEAENNGSRSANNKPISEHRRNIYNKVISAGGGGGVKRVQKTIDGKPVPPPLETLPSKRAEAELRQQQQQQQLTTSHQADEKLSPSSPDPVPKPRMYRQRSAVPSSSGGGAGQRLYSKNPAMMMQQQQRSNTNSPAVDQSSCKQSLTPSPLFNIRYKSMTNLLTATSAADSDTLGSSQSGGRCSGGSAGSAAVRTRHHLHPLPLSKQQHGNGIYGRQISTPSHGHHGGGHHQQHHGPAARLFQLHRPRSLTDLLWGRSGSGGGRNDDFHRSGSKSPLKIQQHPTVVADVIPSSSNRRRLLNGSHHQQLPASTGSHGSSSKNSKHTIFYHL